MFSHDSAAPYLPAIEAQILEKVGIAGGYSHGCLQILHCPSEILQLAAAEGSPPQNDGVVAIERVGPVKQLEGLLRCVLAVHHQCQIPDGVDLHNIMAQSCVPTKHQV